MWSCSVKRLQQRPPKLQGISARHRPETIHIHSSNGSDAAISIGPGQSKQPPNHHVAIPRSDAVRPASVHCLLSFSLRSFISSFPFSSLFIHNCYFVSLYIRSIPPSVCLCLLLQIYLSSFSTRQCLLSIPQRGSESSGSLLSRYSSIWYVTRTVQYGFLANSSP